MANQNQNNVIIVDDSDKSVTFSSGWSTSGVQQEFQRTTHFASQQGSTMTFSFVGTSIEVFGTLPGTTNRQTFTFSVDNATPREFQTPGNSTDPAYHQSFFSQGGLSDAKHTLVVTAKTGTVAAFIDYLLYTQSSSTQTTDATQYFVTETDPDIKYSGAWSPAGVKEDFGSTMGNTKPGSQVDFTFTGTSVAVYGDVDNFTASDMLSASFSIDGANPTTTQYPPPGAAVGFNTQFFLANLLPQKKHTLTIKVQNDKNFWLDYILVSPGKGAAANPAASPAQNSGGSKSPVGAIAGGVVAGVIVIGLIVAAIFYWRRKKLRSKPRPVNPGWDGGTAEARFNHPPLATGTTVSTFFPAPASNVSSSNAPSRHPTMTSQYPASSYTPGPGPGPGAPPSHHRGPSSNTVMTNPYSVSSHSHSGSTPYVQSPPQNPYVHAQDSGFRSYNATAGSGASDEMRPSQVAALSKAAMQKREQMPPAYSED